MFDYTWVIAVLAFYLPLWFAAMWHVLSHRSISDVNKLTWVIVLIFTCFFGLVLYAFLGPPLEGSAAEKEPLRE